MCQTCNQMNALSKKIVLCILVCLTKDKRPHHNVTCRAHKADCTPPEQALIVTGEMVSLKKLKKEKKCLQHRDSTHILLVLQQWRYRYARAYTLEKWTEVGLLYGMPSGMRIYVREMEKVDGEFTCEKMADLSMQW